MTGPRSVSLLALLVGAIVAVSAPAVAQAAFGVDGFFALNCAEGFEKCGEGAGGAQRRLAKTEGYHPGRPGTHLSV